MGQFEKDSRRVSGGAENIGLNRSELSPALGGMKLTRYQKSPDRDRQGFENFINTLFTFL